MSPAGDPTALEHRSVIMLFAAVVGVARLGLVEYAPESVFFDL